MHLRVRAGLRKPHNWLQLMKFCAVGGSGYVVNLCVFALCVELLDLHHLVAATAAFVVAVLNNFWWNRHWTFRARGGRAGFQAARFFAVSVGAFLFAAAVLELLVSVAGVAELPGAGDLDRRRDPAQLHREQDVELRIELVARLSRGAALLVVAALLAAAAAPSADAADLERPAVADRRRRASSSTARARSSGSRLAPTRSARRGATGRSTRPRTRRASAAGR